MNDSLYDEYMRNVLGYQPIINNNYDIYDNNNVQMQELENCYPDIYRIIYPMVQKACSQNTRPITRELIDEMTEEIYWAVEDKEMVENRKKENPTSEDRQRIIANPGLNDLVRILLLRELLGRPGFPGMRPPRPRPPRPPMRPPMGPPRPGIGPFNRNIYGQFDDLYEY